MYEKKYSFNTIPSLYYFEKDLADVANELQYSGLHDCLELGFKGIDLANNNLSYDSRIVLSNADYITLDGQLLISSCSGDSAYVDKLKLRFNPYSHTDFVDADLIANSQNGLLVDAQFSLSNSTSHNPFGIANITNILTAINDLHQKKKHYYLGLIDPRETECITLPEASIWLFNCLMPTSKDKSTKQVYVNNETLITGNFENSQLSPDVLEAKTTLTINRKNSSKITHIALEVSTTHNLAGGNVVESRQFVKNMRTGQIGIVVNLRGENHDYLSVEYDTDDLIYSFSTNLTKLLEYKQSLAYNSST